MTLFVMEKSPHKTASLILERQNNQREHEALEFTATNFLEAIRLINDLENLNHFEIKRGNGNQEILPQPTVNFIIDIDGVLLHTKNEVIRFMKLLLNGRPMEAFQMCRKSMSREYLKTLIEMSKNGKVILVSDRLRLGVNFFPSLGTQARKMFQKHKITVHKGIFKILLTGKSFLNLLERNCTTYYIGSSLRDRKLCQRIRKEMEKAKEPAEKLIFIHVPHHFF